MAVYRNEGTLDRIHRMLTLVAIVGLGIGAVGLYRGFGGQGGTYTPWAGVGLMTVGVVAVVLMRRLARVGVETDSEGIEIRNLLSTRQLRWSEVASFEEPPRRRGFTNAVVRTHDGRGHALAAVGDPGTTSARILRSLQKELVTSRQA